MKRGKMKQTPLLGNFKAPTSVVNTLVPGPQPDLVTNRKSGSRNAPIHLR